MSDDAGSQLDISDRLPEDKLPQLNYRHVVDGEELVICVCQDYKTLEVLMVAHMNRDAFKKTIGTGIAHYWSTSRKKIWLKGESSGHMQKVHSVGVDCDMDAVLLKVEQEGGACHEGYYSCFFREISLEKEHEIKIVGDKVFDAREIYGEK